MSNLIPMQLSNIGKFILNLSNKTWQIMARLFAITGIIAMSALFFKNITEIALITIWAIFLIVCLCNIILICFQNSALSNVCQQMTTLPVIKNATNVKLTQLNTQLYAKSNKAPYQFKPSAVVTTKNYGQIDLVEIKCNPVHNALTIKPLSSTGQAYSKIINYYYKHQCQMIRPLITIKPDKTILTYQDRNNNLYHIIAKAKRIDKIKNINKTINRII